MATPSTISAPRWAALAATAARLLRNDGAEMHTAGWDAVNMFGLHVAAPAATPSGMGMAWLLGEHGDVLDVSPAVVGITLPVGGARLGWATRAPAPPHGSDWWWRGCCSHARHFT